MSGITGSVEVFIDQEWMELNFKYFPDFTLEWAAFHLGVTEEKIQKWCLIHYNRSFTQLKKLFSMERKQKTQFKAYEMAMAGHWGALQWRLMNDSNETVKTTTPIVTEPEDARKPISLNYVPKSLREKKPDEQ